MLISYGGPPNTSRIWEMLVKEMAYHTTSSNLLSAHITTFRKVTMREGSRSAEYSMLLLLR